MKIVHVLTRGDVLGGAQSHVRELSLELRRLGHEVTVMTGAPGIFTEQLRQAGIPWLQVRSLVRPLRPHLDLAALVQVWYALRRLKPDLVCAHTAKAGSLGRAAARLHNIPSVFTPHGWSMFDRTSLQPNPLFCGAEYLAGRLGTCVINVCEFEREYAQQLGVCPAKTLEVVRNGIAEVPLTRARPIDAQPPLIAMVARFAPQKDHATLLQALSGLLCMEWNLLLIGAGDLKPRVVAQADALHLRDRVRILPPGTDVNRWLMEAQMFVLSTHFEAFPISILEAMRAGLPVVATDVGGVSESVHHNQTGLLVRHGDVASLRNALAHLIADPALRVALGSAGQRLWRAQFTASAMAARTLEVYQRALAANSLPGL
ncbi:MAG TPA: glycosyltransferase family 4 protein [Acidobacteriaceae bacterium]|nr:glycosyltransferase family 4 protein [Acidobacteriaceae bacterium]